MQKGYSRVIFHLRGVFVTYNRVINMCSRRLSVSQRVHIAGVGECVRGSNAPSCQCRLALSSFLRSGNFGSLISSIGGIPRRVRSTIGPIQRRAGHS